MIAIALHTVIRVMLASHSTRRARRAAESRGGGSGSGSGDPRWLMDRHWGGRHWGGHDQADEAHGQAHWHMDRHIGCPMDRHIGCRGGWLGTSEASPQWRPFCGQLSSFWRRSARGAEGRSRWPGCALVGRSTSAGGVLPPGSPFCGSCVLSRAPWFGLRDAAASSRRTLSCRRPS